MVGGRVPCTSSRLLVVTLSSAFHHLSRALTAMVTGDRQAGICHACVCVCVCACTHVRACLVESQVERRGGTVGSQRGGAGEPGVASPFCFFFSLSAGFGGLSLSVSFALPLSWWFTKFCIVNSRPLRRRLLGGEVGMGLTERRAVPAAGSACGAGAQLLSRGGETLCI